MKFYLFPLLLLVLPSLAYTQMDTYKYKRELSGIKDQWHQIQLPNAIFKHLQKEVGDIRIYGITPKNDTIEVPYIWSTKPHSTISIDFKTINTSRTKAGHFITFEIPISKSINEIELDFKETDFDWKAQLEGSQDQKNWYTILEDYRIVAIKNDLENYQFTTLNFTDSKYQFYRLHIPTQDDLNLLKARIAYQQVNPNHFTPYPIKNTTTSFDQKRKTSQIDIQLTEPVPVNAIKLSILEKYDYYRPMTIQYATDSIKTSNGWKNIYQYFDNDVLSSSKENDFLLKTRITDKIRLTIRHADNPPLSITSVDVSGIPYQLNARFTESANYFLTYGNDKATTPSYDLKHFINKIPKTISPLTIGPVQKMPASTPVAPIFSSKAWLWGIMLLIIVVLGGFTLKMIRENK